MRIHFNNLTRSKRVAKRLAGEFPDERLTTIQRWLAVIYGYRSWGELQTVTDRGGTPSPDDEDCTAVERAERFAAQVGKLQRVAGCDRERAEAVIRAIRPTARGKSAAPAPAAKPTPVVDVDVLPRPSDIARFIHALGLYASNFAASAFAGALHLSAVEARAALEHYRAEGLMGFAGVEDDIEHWQLTKTGYCVFHASSGRMPRTTKEHLAQCEAVLGRALKEGRGLLARVREVVVGGALCGGRGPVLIGFRTTDAPYSVPAHGELAALLCKLRMAAKVPEWLLALPFFFGDHVPARLARHRVVQDWSSFTLGPEVKALTVDADEAEHIGGVARLLHSLRLKWPNDHFAYGAMRGAGLFDFDPLLPPLENEGRCRDLPVTGVSSPVHLLHEKPAPSEWVKYAADSMRGQSYFRRPESFGQHTNATSLIAAADYLDQCGLLTPKRAEQLLIKSERFGLFSGHEPIDALRGAVMVEREHWLKQREQRAEAAKRRAPPSIDYLVYFDVLNFERPRPVGMVREPATQGANTRDFLSCWDRVMATHNLPGTALGQLSDVYASHLCLAARAATPAEIAAYDEVRAKLRGLRSIVFLNPRATNGFDGAALFRYGVQQPLAIPAALTDPDAGGELSPHVLCGRHGDEVLALIASEPMLARNAQTWLLDITHLSFTSFVERAVQEGVDTTFVRAMGIGSDWTFQHDAAGWTARIAGDDWEVRLERRAGRQHNFVLTLRLQERLREHALAPRGKSERHAYGEESRGRLSELLGFMRRMAMLYHPSAEVMLQSLRPTDKRYEERTFADDAARFEALADLVDWCLNYGRHHILDFHTDRDFPSVSWPSLTRDG